MRRKQFTERQILSILKQHESGEGSLLAYAWITGLNSLAITCFRHWDTKKQVLQILSNSCCFSSMPNLSMSG